ncbi:stage II sporulation protein E [Kineococcus xinjiangensis]|uniref:Stage II sporulation protein E n=1 Tax=Kineococcus xinjiangensis TaxID=512762 RepID=A0A2S6IGQ2_9ACTN|nr:GAF domain-containing SpoIIE family protein phosphatase [Kineococcus xinjiangensis]PPK93389.1 stage II sporulation protein E [Kineococcus xinjiangensis]
MVPGADELTLAMVRTFLDRVHLATPGQLPEVVLESARTLGWTAVLHVVDYEQRLLVPAPPMGMHPCRPQAVDTTLAGRCFRTVQPVTASGEGRGVWIPVVDGADRLGVLEVSAPGGIDLDDATDAERCRLLGHLTGHLIAAKRPYGDALDRLKRRRERTVASELLQQLLPPLTFACDGLVLSGFLQPCYDVAADAFDYSVVDDTAHLAVLDATGHDLRGTVLAAVALSAYRNRRRQGHDLTGSAAAMDEHVGAHSNGERFATGVLAELDLPTGRLRYLNAGHPAPLLMREGRVVKELSGGVRILFGLGDGHAPVAEEALEPGDWIVCYTDGITEARGRDGEFFGLDRLVEHLERSASARLPTPETLRRISHDVLDHQGGVLQDDATLLIAEWSTGGEHTLLSTGTGGIAGEDLSPSPVDGEDVPRR